MLCYIVILLGYKRIATRDYVDSMNLTAAQIAQVNSSIADKLLDATLSDEMVSSIEDMISNKVKNITEGDIYATKDDIGQLMNASQVAELVNGSIADAVANMDTYARADVDSIVSGNCSSIAGELGGNLTRLADSIADTYSTKGDVTAVSDSLKRLKDDVVVRDDVDYGVDVVFDDEGYVPARYGDMLPGRAIECWFSTSDGKEASGVFAYVGIENAFGHQYANGTNKVYIGAEQPHIMKIDAAAELKLATVVRMRITTDAKIATTAHIAALRDTLDGYYDEMAFDSTFVKRSDVVSFRTRRVFTAVGNSSTYTSGDAPDSAIKSSDVLHMHVVEDGSSGGIPVGILLKHSSSQSGSMTFASDSGITATLTSSGDGYAVDVRDGSRSYNVLHLEVVEVLGGDRQVYSKDVVDSQFARRYQLFDERYELVF